MTLDKEEGRLYWKSRAEEGFKTKGAYTRFLRHYEGRVADVSEKGGYRRVNFFGSNIAAHRIIYKMAYGKDPNIVDHIDGDRLNNRPSNLRSVSSYENNNKYVVRQDNKYGCRGVHFDTQRGKYKAVIWFRGKSHSLGRYDRPEDAKEAYLKAYRKFYGDKFLP